MDNKNKKTLRDIFGSQILEYFGDKSAEADMLTREQTDKGTKLSADLSGRGIFGHLISDRNKGSERFNLPTEEEFMNQYIGELIGQQPISTRMSSEGKGRKQEDIMDAIYAFVSPEQDTTYFSKQTRTANPKDERSTYNELMRQSTSEVLASLLGLELGAGSDELPGLARGMEKINLGEGQTIGDFLREFNPGVYEDDFEPFFTRRQGRDMLRPGLLPDAKRGRVR
tara:strand:- start:145 stop:822 length:678 start_codon:yes stop_codon:yes gene_type:complete